MCLLLSEIDLAECVQHPAFFLIGLAPGLPTPRAAEMVQHFHSDAPCGCLLAALVPFHGPGMALGPTV